MRLFKQSFNEQSSSARCPGSKIKATIESMKTASKNETLEIGKRLESYIDASGMNYVDFAKAVATLEGPDSKVGPQTVTYWRQTGKIARDRLKTICQVLNISPSDLLGIRQKHTEPVSLSGSSQVLSWSDADTLPEGFCVVPRYRMAFSMGDGRVMFEVQKYEDGDAFRSGWLATMCLKPDSCFVAKVEGISMEPKLEEGESILVDRSQTTIIDRKIYAICYDGQIYCKRLFKAGNEIIMRSDNAAYPEIRAQAEDVEIIGRVVWHAGVL